MAFSGNKRNRSSLSEINVTPFVDVVLVLLVIFMITAPMLQTGLQVDLPKATLEPIPVDSKPVIVTIDGKRTFYLDDVRYAGDEIESKLMPALKRKSASNTIYLRADRSLPYGVVAEFIGNLYDMGILKVSLVTEPVDKGKR